MSDPITARRQDYVFAMLPPWMREAYNNDALMNEAIKRALHEGADSAGDVALSVCKTLYEHRKAMQEVAQNEAREWNSLYAMRPKASP